MSSYLVYWRRIVFAFVLIITVLEVTVRKEGKVQVRKEVRKEGEVEVLVVVEAIG